MDFKEIINMKEYSFLKEDKHLGDNIILLGLGGSYSYGTNNEESDLDVRGIALDKKSDLIGFSTFEQYTDSNTDTTVYSFNKIIKLLLNCNPNTIEMLGLKKEHYLYLNDYGKDLIDNYNMFLSKRAVYTFGGYADAQLRRLENALARDSLDQSDKEQHIYNSVKNMMYNFNKTYANYDKTNIRIYIDKAVNPEYDTEIFVDGDLRHYPLRDYKGMLTEMQNVIKAYSKIGKRNNKKDDKHLNKHAMHLIRLFMMAIDILEKQKIITYREKEHDLLMSIRNGEFQNSDHTFNSAFYDILKDYEDKLKYATKNTTLPDEPDMEKVQEYVMKVNTEIINKQRD